MQGYVTNVINKYEIMLYPNGFIMLDLFMLFCPQFL